MIQRIRATRSISIALLPAFFCLGPCAAVVAEEKKPAGKEEKITYEEHVKPIFRQKCFTCHNTDKKVAGLDLTTYTTLREGGGSGEVVEPGESSASYMYSLVSHESEPYMPPDSDRLPDEMLAVIKKWIDGGALENAGSKPVMSNKPKFDLALQGAPTGQPEGPAPMPGRLTLEPVVHTDSTTAVSALATSPWAPLVAVAGQQQVLLYHAQTLQLLGTLPFPEGVPYVLKFSRNGSLLLAGGGRGASQGLVVVWDVTTGERVFEVGDELDVVLGADISADQSRIALGGPNRVVRIYSTADGSLLHELTKHTNWVQSVAFSPDGVLLATGDRNGGLFVWEVYTGREYLVLRGHGAGITGLSWRIDSNLLASSSEDTTIRLWEMENGGQVKSWGAHGGGTAGVEFTRDGRLVSCGRDRVAKLWDQNGQQLRAFEAFSDLALKVTHCDETDRLITGDWNGEIRVWNAADGSQLGTLTSNPATLQQRLEAATARLKSQQAGHAKLAADDQSLRMAADKIKAELAAAQKTVADAQAKQKAATGTIDQSNEAIQKLTAERDATNKLVAAFEAAVPLLKEAAAKGQQAAEQLAGDKELAAAAAQLKAQLDQKTTALETAKKTLAEKNAALETSQQQLAAAQKQAEEAKTALGAGQKRVADLMPTLAPAETKAAESKTAVDAAAQTLAAAQQAVNRWTNEIVFRDKLAALDARENEHQELLAAQQSAQGEADRANAELAQATEAAAQSQNQSEAAQANVDQLKQTIGTLTAGRDAAAKAIAAQEPVIPILKETYDKAQQATEKAANDQEIAAAAGQLKSLLEKKTAALEAVRQAHKDKSATLEKSNGELAAADKKAQELTAALEAARKLAAEKAEAAGPLVEKLAAATQTVEAAKAQFDAAQAAVDELKANNPASTAMARAGG